MSDASRAILEDASGRKLDPILAGTHTALVKDVLIVRKDGRGNFTTINNGLTLVPKNALALEGFFFIYMSGGVYEEYVTIEHDMTYLMLLGDDINKTVITSNHSFDDGSWTTFNNATFGNYLHNTYSVDELI